MAGERLSFGDAADRYDRARPSYPPEGVAWLVGTKPARVLELGAGTGKLTEALVELDRDVIAVDPIEEMLEELEVAVPGVPRILGTAEDIPIQDASVDAVVVGQAWHWFQRARAVAEIARVLRPGGVLGLAWNS
ncbi:MAG TPA: class I SAM-dependent methyltransferase, partial [Marmoricola sp.]|nr:class I SAM-dependent methyltransferase [Marmoricola sp.]